VPGLSPGHNIEEVNMQRAAFTVLTGFLGMTYGLEATEAPGPALDPSQCAAVWAVTERDGDTLSEGKARPFIVNFTMVDSNGDGRITQEEFEKGCKGGWVKSEKMNPSP
jgi:hypothetical protein